jgi:REP-associated tyrosine transposase
MATKRKKAKAKAKRKWGHGGARPGAGRKPIPRTERAYVPHIARPVVTKNRPVFARFDCVDGVASLRLKAHRRILEDIFADENRLGFRLVHYSIQSDHLLLLCEANDNPSMWRGLQRIGSRIARVLNKRLERSGRLFRERYFSNVVDNPEQAHDLLRHVLLRRHELAFEAGNKPVTDFDPNTSSAFFDGWKRPWAKGTRTPEAGDPVLPPRSWLLREGWKKHGLLRAKWDG